MRAGRAERALLALAGLAVVILVVAEFLPLYRVVVGQMGTVERTVSAGTNHGYAALLLALAAVPMIVGAARGARPARAALAAIGAVILFVALAIDLPDARSSGAIREAGLYEHARAEPATGFFVETLGAALLLIAGGGLLILAPGGAQRPRADTVGR